jgi:hypothetical protein
VVLAGDRRLFLVEHRVGDPQVVLEALERSERVAVGLVLGLKPGGADAVDRPAAGDGVERRGDLRVLRRDCDR